MMTSTFSTGRAGDWWDANPNAGSLLGMFCAWSWRESIRFKQQVDFAIAPEDGKG